MHFHRLALTLAIGTLASLACAGSQRALAAGPDSRRTICLALTYEGPPRALLPSVVVMDTTKAPWTSWQPLRATPAAPFPGAEGVFFPMTGDSLLIDFHHGLAGLTLRLWRAGSAVTGTAQTWTDYGGPPSQVPLVGQFRACTPAEHAT